MEAAWFCWKAGGAVKQYSSGAYGVAIGYFGRKASFFWLLGCDGTKMASTTALEEYLCLERCGLANKKERDVHFTLLTTSKAVLEEDWPTGFSVELFCRSLANDFTLLLGLVVPRNPLCFGIGPPSR